MNRNLLSGLAIGVFAGFLAGYFVGAGHSNDDAPAATATAAPAPMPNGPVMPAKTTPVEIQQRIAATMELLAADPKNENGWIALGNDYFDTQQAQSAVDAYGRALALAPGNADVLTDQGIMYRQLKAYDKAVANFKQAQKINPKHLQSLFNLGIVYSDDLKNPEAARKAFNQVIVLDPTSAQAAQSRSALESLKTAKP